MDLIKVKSKKYPGAIFLKVKGTKSDFVCKVYASSSTNYVADTIIRAMRTVTTAFVTNKGDNEE